MIEIESSDLNSAIIEASEKLNCPYEDIDYHIIQAPKKGLLGVGRKSAIIVANCKKSRDEIEPTQIFDKQKKDKSSPINISSLLDKKDQLLKSISEKIGYKEDETSKNIEVDSLETKTLNNKEVVKDDSQKVEVKQDRKEEIEQKVRNLILNSTCFEIDVCRVDSIEDDSIYITIDGRDAPLLIGREGYRYKALYFTLSSWLHTSYGLKLTLEVGQFIKKHREIIHRYLLDEVFPVVDKGLSFKTKPLDEFLLKIALKEIREKYPEKYVKIRDSVEGDKFIVIDEFFTKKF